MENELDELRSIQATSTPEPYRDAQPLPWWKRKLLQMQTQDIGQGIQQAQGGGGESVVNNWASLGKGVGNLAKKFIGMADGGAVQGPTMAMIGEGGEPEYVVPESKALPFAMRTLQDGIPPNPASLPRTEKRPPPPVILANTPAMACGGKVIPKMAQGGMVVPNDEFLRQANPYFGASMPQPPSIMEAPQYADFSAGADRGHQFTGLKLLEENKANLTPTRQAQVPMQTFEQRKRLQELVAQGAPAPKFYDRLFMGEGNGPMDMRPGVAPYSVAGRAAGKIISSLLPYNKKRDEYQRQIEAAKVGSQLEESQNAAAIKQQELEQRGRVADAQLESYKSTTALRNKQSAAMDAPPPRKLRVTDYTNAETGDVTRVWNDENTGDEVKREVLGGVAKPKPTNQSLTIKETTDKDGNVRRDFYNPDGTLNRTETLPKAGKPMKTGGAGGASSEAAQVALSDEDERLAQNIADGVYKPTDIPVGKDNKKKAILARAAELGYGGGGQSASDAKLGGIVETLPNELEKLRGIVRGGYRGMVAGYQSGTNREIVRLIDNIADKVGRLRSGGAINRDEEARFLRQLGTDKADLLFGSAEEAEKAIDGVLAEAQAVSGRMKKPPKAAAAGQKPNAEKAAPASGRQVRDKRTGDVRTLKPGQDVNAFVKQYPQFEAVAAKGKE